MSEQLKSCPFCGGEAELLYPVHRMEEFRNHDVVRCTKCGVSVERNTALKVVEAWNRRVNDE